MAHLLPNKFSTYSLSENEELLGSILSESQKQVLQNIRSSIAEEKLRITFDPLNPVAFAQREAELQGQLNILELILSNSDDALTTLNNNPDGRN